MLLRAQIRMLYQADRSCEWWSGQGTQCFTIQPKTNEMGTHETETSGNFGGNGNFDEKIDAKTDNGELLFPQLEQCVCIIQFDKYMIHNITLKLEYCQK